MIHSRMRRIAQGKKCEASDGANLSVLDVTIGREWMRPHTGWRFNRREMKFCLYILYICCTVLCIAFAAPAFAEDHPDVVKAKEFIMAGMYAEAKDLLKKRIHDKPMDAEAHFQLGICYLKLKEHKKADKRFSSAVKLEPVYESKVKEEYEKAGVDRSRKAKEADTKSKFYDLKRILRIDSP